MQKDGTSQAAVQGGPKSKPLQNYQKILLKSANEIRFLREIKEKIKHSNIIRWYYNSLIGLLFDVNNYA